MSTHKTDVHPDDPRVARVHELFAWPVLIASLATVIGLLLTLASEPIDQIGEELVMLASLVIVGESLMVLLVSGDKRRWFKRHWPLVLISVIVLFLFAVGVSLPVHLLRLVRGFSTSPVGQVLQHAKVLHVGEFGHAKEHLAASSKLAERLHKPLETFISLAVPVYLVATLRDPDSDSRELLRLAEDLFVGAHWRLGAAIIAIGVTVLLVKRRVKNGAH